MEQKAKVRFNERILYPDFLRVLAVFAVMIIHVCAYGFYNYNIHSYEWQVVNFYNSLSRWAVPIFVMISGKFFLDPQREISIKKLYRKNIFRIVTALFFWGALYQSFNVVKRIVLENCDAFSVVVDALKEFILGPAWFHLWFLYMIVGLYMFVPLFRIFTQNAKEEHFRYLFILFFLFGSLYPFMQDMLLYLDGSLRLYFSLKEFLGYSCYFILGYYLSVYNLSKKLKSIIYVIAVFSVILQIIGATIIGSNYGTDSKILHSYFTPNVVCQAIAVFVFVKEICSKLVFSDRIMSSICLLGKYSFGMYLVHDFFNGLFYRIGFSVTSFCPILAVPLRTMVTFILSFLVVFVLDKMPIIKKYCM